MNKNWIDALFTTSSMGLITSTLFTFISLSIFTNSDLPRQNQVVTRHVAELGIVFRTSFFNTINNLTLGICSDAWTPAMTLYQGKWETFCTNRPYLSLYFSFANNLQCIFLISFPVKKSRWKVHFNAFSLLRLFFSMPLLAIIQFHWFLLQIWVLSLYLLQKNDTSLKYIFGCDVGYKWMLFSPLILL